jgi:hypothetical protein
MPMAALNNPVVDPDREVLYISQNIGEDYEPKFYRLVISEPNMDL